MEACGASGPLQLSLEDSSRPGALRRVFHQPFVVIGRNPTSDLLLDHWRVSRRHAYLQLVKGRLFCLDLGSRTGIEWDDGTKDSDWLDPGRSLIVGPYEISLWADSALEPPEPASMDEAWKATNAEDENGKGSYAIEFLNAAGRLPPIRLGQSLALVGSSTECRVRLPYSDVSKAHCALLRSHLGVWVVDLLGRGGTFVNETHVRFARLDDGDELRIGRHILRFDLDGSRSSSSSRLLSPPRPPSRSLSHRTDNETLPARIEQRHQYLPAAPLSSPTVPMTASWQYPDYEIQRAVGANHANQADLIQALMQPMVQQFSAMQQQMFEQFHQAMMGMFQTFGAAYREQMNELREELDEVRRITTELQELQAQTQAQARAAGPKPPAIPQPPSHAELRTKPGETKEAPARSKSPEADEPTPQPRRTPPTKADVGVHNILLERISALQNERQSRWQKILAKLNKA